MPQKAETTVVLRDKELYIVRREGTANWQVHYKAKSLKRWIRKSTGTSDLQEAKTIAEDYAADTRAAERRGFPVISKKFKAVAEIVSANLKEQVKNGIGKKIYKDYYRAIDQYLIPFFGKYNVDCITPAVISEFHDWRYQQIGRRLKQSTQHTHNLALNAVFSHAIEVGYMTEFLRPKLKNTGEAGEARGTFTKEEHLKLLAFLQQWALEGRTQASRDLRELLPLYCAFLAATGVRHGTETEKLQWRHIEFIEKNGEKLIHIYLPQGKTGPRYIIARHEIWPVLEKLRQLQSEFQGITLDQLVKSKNEQFIFRMRSGIKPYGFSNVFGDGIRAANMLTNGIDNKTRSLYSYRHYYATQRLMDGYSHEDLEVQMGTSAEMLRKHYSHMEPLMIAERLAGGKASEQSEEIQKLIHSSRADLIEMVGLATGIYLPLEEHNQEAAQEFADELVKRAKQRK